MQFIDQVIEIPVLTQRLITMVQTTQNTIDISCLHHSEKEVDVLGEQDWWVTQAQVVQKTVAMPQNELIDRTVNVL